MTNPGIPEDEIAPTRADLLAQVVALQGRLDTLPAIEQAKGALMLTYGLTADAAFDLLRFHSQHGNVKIRAIAAQLTSLISASPSSAEAITRFDRLLADATRHLQQAARPAGTRTTDQHDSPVPAAGTVIPAQDMAQVTMHAVAAAPPGITIAANAPDEPLVYANDAFASLTGYPIGDVLRRNCRILQGPATNRRDTATIRRAIDTRQDVSVVLQNYRSDGTTFWNEVSISPIRDADNQITYFVGTQTDVTLRVRATRAANGSPTA